MSIRGESNGLVWVDHEPGEPYPETDTDWAAVEAITDVQIRAAALTDPDSVPVPVYDTPGLTHQVNVKRLRERLGLTQEAFAATYRIPVGTLRDWEQGRKNPDAPARAYLTVIAIRKLWRSGCGLRRKLFRILKADRYPRSQSLAF